MKKIPYNLTGATNNESLWSISGLTAEELKALANFLYLLTHLPYLPDPSQSATAPD